MSMAPLQAETVISNFSPYFDEAYSRPVRRTRLEVIQKTHSPTHPFAFPGTVFAILCDGKSGHLPTIREAVAGDGESARKLVARWKEQAGKRRKVEVGEAVRSLIAAPVFAELEYGGATIVNGLQIPAGMDCVILMLPYNGGKLADTGFVLAEHFQEGSDASLTGVIVQTAPTLTPAESDALSQVSADQLRLNVGMVLDCCTTGAAVASVVADVVLLVIALLEPAYHGALALHVSDAEIERLGPNASARRLLQLRREFLSKQVKRG